MPSDPVDSDLRYFAKPVSFVSGTRPRLQLSDESKEAVRELTWQVSKTFYERILKTSDIMLPIDTGSPLPPTCWARLGRPDVFDPSEG